jgi:hypothetical protein
VSGSLPTRGNVQVIREDPKNRNLLYAGTEFGLFISVDGGTKWEPFMTGYPVVRTDDILVHPRDGDLIVATHGRSIWIADDITPLQQWTPTVAAADATLFDVRTAVAYANDVKLDVYTGGDKQFEGENPQRGTAVHFYLKSAAEAKVTIADQTGRGLCETNVKGVAGMNRVQWTLVAPMLAAAAAPAGGRGAGPGGAAGGGRAAGAGGPGAPPAAGAPPVPAAAAAPAAQPAAPAPDMSCAPSAAGGGGGRGGAAAGATPGSYVVKLSVGGKEYTKAVQVLEDRWMRER